jgi:hypothetical protein
MKINSLLPFGCKDRPMELSIMNIYPIYDLFNICEGVERRRGEGEREEERIRERGREKKGRRGANPPAE